MARSGAAISFRRDAGEVRRFHGVPVPRPVGQMRIPCEHGSRQTVFHRGKPGGGQRDWSTLPKIRDGQRMCFVFHISHLAAAEGRVRPYSIRSKRTRFAPGGTIIAPAKPGCNRAAVQAVPSKLAAGRSRGYSDSRNRWRSRLCKGGRGEGEQKRDEPLGFLFSVSHFSPFPSFLITRPRHPVGLSSQIIEPTVWS
jgi:hypothetical protein